MKENAPIYKAIKNYAGETNLRLHMPGHAGGKGIMPIEMQQLAEIDITEIDGIGDMHTFSGAIEEGRKLLAQAYQASESLFLVNGASSGIHTLFMTVGSNQKVLVPRNAHRSLYGGMVLSGVQPVYIPAPIDQKFGISLPIDAKDIILTINQNTDLNAIFLVSPDYYGLCCDLETLVESIHRINRDVLVFVDEAHGGHFIFHKEYPMSAIVSGADAAVNGLHKTLPVLNQGGCLHTARKSLFWEKIFPAWSLLTTTSPSFPVIASIDFARNIMVNQGYELLDQALNLAREYRQRIMEIKGLGVLDEEHITAQNIFRYDPLKVLISIEGLEIDGFQIAEMLHQNYHIQVESQGQHYILAMMSIFHGSKDWEFLLEALQDIAAKYPARTKREFSVLQSPIPRLALTPREAFFAPKKIIDFKACRGKIAGEMVAPYPPGIPCILPGEYIDEQIYNYLQDIKARYIPVHGILDRSLNKIAVID